MSEKSPLLELENVSKDFGNVRALQNVSTKVVAGQVTCVLGDNGAGKSTFIKIISGLHKPSGGKAQALPAGLEGVLRAGANAKSLARTGRMAASPSAGYPAQTLEAAPDNLSRTQGTGGIGRCGQTSGGQLPSVVAQQ